MGTETGKAKQGVWKGKEYTIAVDPSLNFCGIAVFRKGKLLRWGLLKYEKGMREAHYLVKARSMVRRIVELYAEHGGPAGSDIVTEIPQHFGASGYLARESGSVFKLTFLCGMIYNIDENVKTYEPNQWKGQLPKEVVRRRLMKVYPDIVDDKLDHNIVDAIGIGHKHIFGKL